MYSLKRIMFTVEFLLDADKHSPGYSFIRCNGDTDFVLNAPWPRAG